RRRRVGVDAIRALNRVRDRQRDERLLALAQRALGEDRAVPREELLPKLRRRLADVAELLQVLRIVVGVHSFVSARARLRSGARMLAKAGIAARAIVPARLTGAQQTQGAMTSIEALTSALRRLPGRTGATLCHAPFAQLHFDPDGHVSVCSKSTHRRLGHV